MGKVGTPASRLRHDRRCPRLRTKTGRSNCQEGETSREDLHRLRLAVHVAQKVGEVVGRDHDVQQELQSEEEGRWAPRGGGEDEYDDDDGRLILMAPVVGGVTHDPLKAHRQLELVWAAQRWQLRP